MGSNVKKRENHIRLHFGLGRKNLKRALHKPGMHRQQNQKPTLHQRNSQFPPGWNCLNRDLQQKILEQLPIADLMNACLAGLDRETAQLRCSTRDLMHKRCRQLQPLWEEWKNSSRFKSRDYRHTCTPVQFTTLKSFTACHCSISSMKHLWHIRDLKYLKIKFCPLFKPQLQDLNDTLRGCSGLLRLNLSSYPYQLFPEGVLTLKKLRYLDFSRSHNMENQLPEDMGERLPQLQFLDLSHCNWITHIPESILVRLEAHRKQKLSSGRRQKYPSILLQGCHAGQKEKLVPADKYPRLAESLSSIESVFRASA